MVVANLAQTRFDATKRSQGPQAGNWTISSHDGATDSISEGCLQVENYVSVLNTADATAYGASSISTKGGIDALGSLRMKGKGTFEDVLTALSAVIQQNATISGSLTAASAVLSGASGTTLAIPNGLLTTLNATVNGQFVTTATSNAQFNGPSQFGANVSITSVTDSTALGLGSLVTSGGASFALNTQTGGNIYGAQNIIAALQLKGAQGVFSSTNDAASSTTSASIYTMGGLYAEKDAVTKGPLAVYAGSTSAPRFAVNNANFKFTPDGTNDVFVGNASGLTASAPINFANTNNATDYLGTNASALFQGGVVVLKDQYLNGSL